MTDEAVMWSRPTPIEWVAMSGERFLGFIEVYDGHYVANDTAKDSYRTFRSLQRAKRAIEVS